MDRPEIVSFWEVPICLRHCKCGKTGRGLIHIERDLPGFMHTGKLFDVGERDEEEEFEYLDSLIEDEDEERNMGILDRLKFKKTASLFSNVFEDKENKEEDILRHHRTGTLKDDIEEFLEKKEPYFGGKRHVGCKRSDIHHKGYNIPELMRYADYDKKAWNFFNRYEEEI